MRLSASHGYVGMYVVDKAYRGLGIGKQVWDAAMGHLGGRNAGLSAVAHLFTLYRDKAGFSTVADWTVDLYRLENLASVLPYCARHQQKMQPAKGQTKPGQKHLNLYHQHQHPQHQAPTSPPTQHQLRRKKAKKAAVMLTASADENVVVDIAPSGRKFHHSGHHHSLLEYSIAQEVVVLVDEEEEEKEEVNGERIAQEQLSTKAVPTFAELASTAFAASNNVEDCSNFFCLLQQYQQSRSEQKQKFAKSKYLRSSNSSIEQQQQVSDDESYGFSSLFFDHNKGNSSGVGGDEDDSGEEVVEVLKEEREEEDEEEEEEENEDKVQVGVVEEVLEIEGEEPNERLTTENSIISNNSTDEISDLDDEEEEVTAEEVAIPGKKFVKKKQQNQSCNSLHLHRPQYSGKLRTEAVDASSSKHNFLVEGILAYDRALHSYDRSRIVRLTLGEEHCLARAALLGGTVVGYGAIKLNLQNMWIVSPLYADSDYIARLLLLDLLADLAFYRQKLQQKQQQQQGRRGQHRGAGHSRPSSVSRGEHQECLPLPVTGSSVVLKVPSSNRHAASMLEALGFSKQEYSLRRCYTQRLEEVPTQAIYALHTSVFCTE